jgi:hypothetical protein
MMKDEIDELIKRMDKIETAVFQLKLDQDGCTKMDQCWAREIMQMKIAIERLTKLIEAPLS